MHTQCLNPVYAVLAPNLAAVPKYERALQYVNAVPHVLLEYVKAHGISSLAF